MNTYLFLQASKPPSINTNKNTTEYYSDDEELHPLQSDSIPSLAAISPTNAQKIITTSTNLDTYDVDILHQDDAYHTHPNSLPTHLNQMSTIHPISFQLQTLYTTMKMTRLKGSTMRNIPTLE